MDTDARELSVQPPELVLDEALDRRGAELDELLDTDATELSVQLTEVVLDEALDRRGAEDGDDVLRFVRVGDVAGPPP